MCDASVMVNNTNFYKNTTLIEGNSFSENITVPEPKLEVLDRYIIHRVLAKGGMNRIYLATDTESGHLVCIKMLLPKYISNEQALHRFRNECELLTKVDSPFFTPILYEGNWEGTPYFVMNYVEGIQLREYLQKKRIPLSKGVKLMQVISSAVSYLHGQKIIHCDLKPENILVTQNDQIKIIDLGIARPLENPGAAKESSSQERGIMGTPVYMSPEQKEQPNSIHFSSDIYALGVIFYELTLGQLSYGMIHLPLIPTGLQGIIRKCLRNNAIERYRSGFELHASLTAYLATQQHHKDCQKKDTPYLFLDEIEEAVKEMLTPLQKPLHAIDVGLIERKGVLGEMVYCDIFPFNEKVSIAFIAESVQKGGSALVQYMALKNSLSTLLACHLDELSDPLNVISFINQFLHTHTSYGKFVFSFAILDPDAQQLCYLSSGATKSWFIYQPGETIAHSLCSQNPVLGESSEDLFSFVIPWNSQNVLLLISDIFTKSSMDKDLQLALEMNYTLPAQKLVETVWNQMTPKLDSLVNHQGAAALIALKKK